jgi:hypothetical protein
MLILAAFTAIALVAAGVFAVFSGDSFAYSVALIVLLLAVLFIAPQLPSLLAVLQHAFDAAVPLAHR